MHFIEIYSNLKRMNIVFLIAQLTIYDLWPHNDGQARWMVKRTLNTFAYLHLNIKEAQEYTNELEKNII